MNLHLVSDATGETLNSIARATVAQFEHVSIIYHRWSLIRTRFQLHRVLEGIEAEPGPVLSTVIDKALRNDLETTCLRLGVAVVNVLDPEAVVVGGGLGLAGGRYWDALVDAARRHVWADAARGLPVVPAALGADAGLLGAAAHAQGMCP